MQTNKWTVSRLQMGKKYGFCMFAAGESCISDDDLRLFKDNERNLRWNINKNSKWHLQQLKRRHSYGIIVDHKYL